MIPPEVRSSIEEQARKEALEEFRSEPVMFNYSTVDDWKHDHVIWELCVKTHTSALIAERLKAWEREEAMKVFVGAAAVVRVKASHLASLLSLPGDDQRQVEVTRAIKKFDDALRAMPAFSTLTTNSNV